MIRHLLKLVWARKRANALLIIEIAMVAYTLPASLRFIGEPPAQFLRFVLDVPAAVRACRRWCSDRALH